ncbi:MAG: hypothetical protein ACI9WS_000809, partial [Paraglaciecola psychrophila]
MFSALPYHICINYPVLAYNAAAGFPVEIVAPTNVISISVISLVIP